MTNCSCKSWGVITTSYTADMTVKEMMKDRGGRRRRKSQNRILQNDSREGKERLIQENSGRTD